jgi:hypothetical protein
MHKPQAASAFVSSRLTKGGVSLDEVQTLLRAWQPGEPLADFGVRVRQQGILPKQTAQRSADVMSLLRVWLFTPDATAAQRMKQLVERGVERQTLAQLLFLYKARAERALYAFTIEGYWPESRDGALYLRTEEIAHFLQQAAETGQAAQAWTSSTLERTAQGVLRALIDGGLVSKSAIGAHEIVSFAPADFAVAYLSYDLHLAGYTDSALVEHPDWRLWGCAPAAVLNALEQLPAAAGLLVQRGGGIVNISWQYAGMYEVIDAWLR